LVFLEGTHYLVYNLFISLSLAILLISLIMAWMFRSPKMILISLLPNLLPLIITAGLMGYFGVPIKPSTILVFSIAFGISVDDTIHFLAKYRQELSASNWNIKPSIFNAISETGKSMFYTSIVLFFGFLTFTLSSFGGTQALGGLVSITLLIAMITNLVLLPSLLLSLEKRLSNKTDFKEPMVPLDSDEEEDVDGNDEL
ncbi:MAG: MMPL family transporter, partial [Flavobacteriales bacterium]|nr:MMPL family transporter [Flavobacteriales bacterium]